MVILIALLIVLTAYYSSRQIKTNAILLYTSALIISGASILFYDGTENLIITGGLGLSFLLIVMYTGILKRGTNIQKQLRDVRREFAIIGFILVSPNVYRIIFESVYTKTPLEIIGLIAYVSLIPLFITSFKLIRSKIPTSLWIKIHRNAYLSYALIFIHLMTISNYQDAILYYFVFTIYSVFKLKTFFKKKPILKATLITVVVGSSSLLLLSAVPHQFEKPVDIIEGQTFNDGTYIGYAKGYHNEDTLVRVIMEDDEIKLIVLEACGCTPLVNDGYYYDIAYEVAQDIRRENNTGVDYIAGATQTSRAVSKAVRDALEHAIIK